MVDQAKSKTKDSKKTSKLENIGGVDAKPSSEPLPVAPPAHTPTHYDSSENPTPAWSFKPAIPAAKPTGAVSAAELTGKAQLSPITSPKVEPLKSIVSSFGPLGKLRSRFAVVFLNIITLGIYGFFWIYRTGNEVRNFDSRIEVKPSRTVWAVFIPWIAGIATAIFGGVEILARYRGIDLSLNLDYKISYPLLAALLLIPYATLVLPFSVVAIVMFAERIRNVQEHLGIEPDRQIRPQRVVLWLALPIVGGLIWCTKQQKTLNGIWHLAIAQVDSQGGLRNGSKVNG